VGGSARWQIARDVGLLTLALVAFFVVTYEFAFVHEPQLLTALLVYRIDRVFLAALYQPWRRTGGSKASAYQAALDRPSVTATMRPWAIAASREPSVPRMFGHPGEVQFLRSAEAVSRLAIGPKTRQAQASS
jgi:hypothetical protein